GEVVGDGLLADCLVHRGVDQVRRLLPAQIFQHQHAGQNDRTRVHLVQTGIFGGGAVGRFKNGVPGVVVDVGSGSDSDAAHLGRQGVGNVVPVQVEGGDHVVLGGAGEDLLQEGVGDHILDDDLAGLFRLGLGAVGRFLALLFGDPVVLSPGEHLVAELPLGQLIAPFLEGAFGNLHDVPLVDQADALPAVIQG